MLATFMPRIQLRHVETIPCFSHRMVNLAYQDAISSFFSHVSLIKGYSSSYQWHRQVAHGKLVRFSKLSSALARTSTLILQRHSAFLACSFNSGAVPSFVTFPFSISAAHSAAPTVFVNANRILAIGTSSSRTAATPKLIRTYQHITRIPKPLYRRRVEVTHLVYAALYSWICFCFCVLFHCFN